MQPTTLETSVCPVVLCLCACLCVCMCLIRIIYMRFTLLTNFEVHNIILLTIDTMLYSTSLKLIHLVKLKLYTY